MTSDEKYIIERVKIGYRNWLLKESHVHPEIVKVASGIKIIDDKVELTSNIELLPLDDSTNDLIWHHQTAFKNKGLDAVRKTGFSKQTFKGTITQIVAYNCIPLSVKEHNWLHSRQRNKNPKELKCIDTGLGHQEKIKELFRKEIVEAYKSEKS